MHLEKFAETRGFSCSGSSVYMPSGFGDSVGNAARMVPTLNANQAPHPSTNLSIRTPPNTTAIPQSQQVRALAHEKDPQQHHKTGPDRRLHRVRRSRRYALHRDRQ
jgi:hypothetical protein